MRLRQALAALVVTGMAASPAGRAAQPEQVTTPVALAVVRADGLLIPFAGWDGSRWTNTWPVPERTAGTPISVADIPATWWGVAGPAAVWHVAFSGGLVGQATVTRPTWYPAHCQQGIALAPASAPRGPVPPLTVQPYPKSGLATSVPLTITPITVMKDTAPVWHTTTRALQTRVHVREDPIAKRLVVNGWRHPVASFNRRRVPVVLDALYRAPVGAGRFLYYFEAVKRYPRLPPVRQAADDPTDNLPPDCNVVTFASGWFVAGSADRPAIEHLEVRMTACGAADMDVMWPLGQFWSEGDPVWAAQMSGWGRERYVLVRWDRARTRARPLIDTSGGQCPRSGHE